MAAAAEAAAARRCKLTCSLLSGLVVVLACPASAAAGLQPVLVHLSKNDKGKFSFNPISVNLMTEVFKVVFALIVLLILVSARPNSRAAAPWDAAMQHGMR